MELEAAGLEQEDLKAKVGVAEAGKAGAEEALRAKLAEQETHLEQLRAKVCGHLPLAASLPRCALPPPPNTLLPVSRCLSAYDPWFPS